jgi:hypothetical protein
MDMADLDKKIEDTKIEPVEEAMNTMYNLTCYSTIYMQYAPALYDMGMRIIEKLF